MAGKVRAHPVHGLDADLIGERAQERGRNPASRRSRRRRNRSPVRRVPQQFQRIIRMAAKALDMIRLITIVSTPVQAGRIRQDHVNAAREDREPDDRPAADPVADDATGKRSCGG
jgi:hypothetical protein